jgi:hypothetical protein
LYFALFSERKINSTTSMTPCISWPFFFFSVITPEGKLKRGKSLSDCLEMSFPYTFAVSFNQSLSVALKILCVDLSESS